MELFLVHLFLSNLAVMRSHLSMCLIFFIFLSSKFFFSGFFIKTICKNT